MDQNPHALGACTQGPSRLWRTCQLQPPGLLFLGDIRKVWARTKMDHKCWARAPLFISGAFLLSHGVQRKKPRSLAKPGRQKPSPTGWRSGKIFLPTLRHVWWLSYRLIQILCHCPGKGAWARAQASGAHRSPPRESTFVVPPSTMSSDATPALAQGRHPFPSESGSLTR